MIAQKALVEALDALNSPRPSLVVEPDHGAQRQVEQENPRGLKARNRSATAHGEMALNSVPIADLDAGGAAQYQPRS